MGHDMPNFNDVAVTTVFDKVVSYGLATGRFQHVNQHEPKNAPGNGLECSVWVNSVVPIKGSGLNSTSGIVVLYARIYTNFRQQPFDYIDPSVLSAAIDLMGAMSADFNFGGDAGVRSVDLLGMFASVPLSAQAGYVEIDRQMFRVMTITIPIIIDDMFIQGSTT
jgi:hypothetical protein